MFKMKRLYGNLWKKQPDINTFFLFERPQFLIKSVSLPCGTLGLHHLLAQPLFEIVPVNQRQMILANQSYERFGKGRHPAKLNFGDLFSYALAKSRNLPLLFKGDDFSMTDLLFCLGTDRT